ncbi:uncharacterized protein ACWYII_000552 isoform 1-T1 [Salvelinus alpinus]
MVTSGGQPETYTTRDFLLNSSSQTDRAISTERDNKDIQAIWPLEGWQWKFRGNPTNSIFQVLTLDLIGEADTISRNNDELDYRKRRAKQAPINIDGAVVEQVESFKFLGVHITNKLSWSKHSKTVVKRARQNLFPLRRQKRFGMGPQILKRFYSCTIESILTGFHHRLVWQLLGI